MDNLEKYRKIYLHTKVPTNLQHEGWNYIRTEITRQDLPSRSKGWWPSLALTTLALVLTLTGIAQAANPGQILYPVKITTDNLVSKLTSQPQIPIEKRADEVVKFSQQPDSPQLNQAASQYQKSLQQAQKEASEEGKNPELKQSLEDQADRLEQAAKSNPQSSKQLQLLIEETKKLHGEVQGAHTQNHGNGGEDSRQNNHSSDGDQNRSNRDH